MANSLVVFLSHGIPAFGFIFYGISLFVTNCLGAPRGSNELKESRLLALAKRVESYIALLGSAAVIAFHCIVQPTRSFPDLEHIAMALPFFIYGLALRWKASLPSGFADLMGAAAFAQEFLLFHWHSLDDTGVESHYHALLQITVMACALTSLGEIFVRHHQTTIKLSRSISIAFQGVWLLQLSLVFVFPSLFLDRDCQVNSHHGHIRIECANQELANKSKAVATMVFSSHLSLLMAACATLYLLIEKRASFYSPVGTNSWDDQA
ncbi:uncharacterized protein LOC112341994 [Selaginella moellendorffii]|uniref:uncharacterized protein LOC112341994 n=1 Tax=Selaginella moellendorffii TaxID=88036 RepID=UPI000D1CE046|nr:uncharacterized protein LOC112341994 [Selaginella moellendorffii]|eukprot:XP_024518841.1 uncharacterized protein LOC112341994 [Selaginella moellendorffii]